MKLKHYLLSLILLTIFGITVSGLNSTQKLLSLFSSDIISYAESTTCPPSKCHNGGCYQEKCTLSLKVGAMWAGIGVLEDIEVGAEADPGYFACCMCEANVPSIGSISCWAHCFSNSCCTGISTY